MRVAEPRYTFVDVVELERLVARAVDAGVRSALEQHRSDRGEGWLGTAQVAELLHVHPRTVAKLAKAGALPSAKLGKLLRFRRTDVDALLARTKAG